MTPNPVPDASTKEDFADELAPWRTQIDALDQQLLHLLQKRVECALGVGEIKKRHNLPFHDPAREQAIYEKLRLKQREIEGTLPPSAITAIYREIISACRAAEHPTSVAFLGPAGTNTQEAAVQFFGSAVEGLPCANPDEVCRAVASGAVSYGVLAIENSIHGLVSPTLDLLADAPITAIAEIELLIHHCLLSNVDAERVTKVYSHEQALAQCRGWLGAHLPGATLVPVTSTARGAEMAAQEAGAAAIGSALAANLYGLQIAARNIEDLAGNKTRFWVVAGRDKTPKPSGRDKTSLTFLTPHKPGALVEVLGVFSRNGVNLMMIQSRPSRQAAWEYRFFADISGHQNDENLQRALKELETHTVSYKVIGSYPEA
jgi:chorismate mutase/prephenate dehydratase